jgi:hypothetical protein
MATIVTLLCLVNGDSSAFPVRIDKTLLVGDLKNEIKKAKAPEFDNFAADKLTLWKVNIPDDGEAAIQRLALQADTANEIKMRPTKKIGEYYREQPAEGHIHVVIERPAVGGACVEGKY